MSPGVRPAIHPPSRDPESTGPAARWTLEGARAARESSITASYTGATLGGRYLVGEFLGKGGWGAVYEARQIDLGRRVAIKILHSGRMPETEILERLAREARFAASLSHPNIAQVSDFHMPNDEPPFIVMEHLSGVTLGALLRSDRRVSPRRICAVAHQLLSALEVAHGAGIIHCDVKPDNVFLVAAPGVEDFVKLLDFGIAKLCSGGLAPPQQTGTLQGTPAFMAPEQITESTIDRRVDIYAVGATMYYAISGRYAIDATSVSDLLSGIVHEQPPPLASIHPGIDPRLASIVDRAMHKDPVARFASAAEMRAALEPFAYATPMLRSSIHPRKMSEDVPTTVRSSVPCALPRPSPMPPAVAEAEESTPDPSSEAAPASARVPPKSFLAVLVVATIILLGLLVLGAGAAGAYFVIRWGPTHGP